MARLSTTLLIGSTLLFTAACSHKHPAELPPAPGPAPAPEQTTPEAPSGPVGNAVVPGSAADFRQSVQSDTIHFDTDKYNVDSTASAILDSQAAWLNKYPNVRITIEGHSTSGARASTTSRWATAAPMRRRTISPSTAFRPIASTRSATARNARSRWARRPTPGRRTAAP